MGDILVGAGALALLVAGTLMIQGGARERRAAREAADIQRLTGAWSVVPSPLAADEPQRSWAMQAWYSLMEVTMPRSPLEYATGTPYQPRHAGRETWTERQRRIANTATGQFRTLNSEWRDATGEVVSPWTNA